MPVPLREAHKSVVKGPASWSGSYKTSQELPTRTFIQAPVRQDLHKIFCDLCRIMQEPLREEYLTGSPPEPAEAKIHHENATDQERENTAGQTLREPAQSKCT